MHLLVAAEKNVEERCPLRLEITSGLHIRNSNDYGENHRGYMSTDREHISSKEKLERISSICRIITVHVELLVQSFSRAPSIILGAGDLLIFQWSPKAIHLLIFLHTSITVFPETDVPKNTP
jgi:hypothetical protein